MEDKIVSISESYNARRNRLLRQGILVLLSSLGCWSMGSTITYTSILVTSLQDDSSNIYGGIMNFTETQLDLCNSLIPLGIPVGSLGVPAVMGVWGRRPALLVSCLCMILSWMGVAFSPSTSGLLIARFVSGIANGGFSCVCNAYAVEVSDVSVRGVMATMPSVGVIAGQVVTAGLGYGFRYYTVALIDCFLPLLLALITLIWLPETPSFLIIKDRDNEARSVLERLRGPTADLDEEIAECRRLNMATRGSSWRNLLHPHILKQVAVVNAIFIIQIFSGYMVIIMNSSRILENAGSSIDENLATLIVTLVQLAGVIVACYLLDKIGRKKSFVLSLGIMVVSLASLAVYVVISDQKHYIGEHETEDASSNGWIPVMCVMICLFGSSLGVQPVPFILMNEYVPTWVRPAMNVEVHMVAALSSFVAQTLYTPMLEGLTQAGLYSFYCGICIIGIPFTVFIMRETQGKQVG